MPTLSSLADAESWLSRIRPRPVSFSSPYPASDCLQRLATVTTHRGTTSWYLDSRTVGHKAPRLRGEVGPSRILVAQWVAASGRGGLFVPWLDVRLEPGAGGGTTLRGTVGPDPNSLGRIGRDLNARLVVLILAGFLGLIAVAGVAGLIYLLVRGDLSSLPQTLIPFGFVGTFAGICVAGLRQLERGIPKLVQEMNDVLDSTAAFTDPW